MKAHLVQLDIAWEDKPANRGAVTRLVTNAGVLPGDLIILPEMFDTGFSFNLSRTADADGLTLSFLQGLARGRAAFVHGARTLVDGSGRGRNMSTVIAPTGEILAEYEKVHPFSLGVPGERESDHFPGARRVVVYDWISSPAQILRVCPAICFDLRFPELFRLGLLAGAEMFIVPANWPDVRAAHYRALLIARAIENQAFVIGVNRVGPDPRLAYHGGSVVIDPTGAILAELDDREAVLSVDINPDAVRDWRARFPAWRDHRLIAHGPG